MKTRIVILFAAISGLFGQGLLCQSLVGTAGQSVQAAGTFVSWTIGEPIIHTLSGTQTSLTQGFQQPWERYRVHGQVRYANIQATPVQDIQVLLHPLENAPVHANTSKHGGHYYLYSIPPGQYTFSGQSSLPVGSVNATDALLVMKHFVQQIQLAGIFLEAADVDASGSVNTTDALHICRFFVDSISSFNAGNWLLDKDTVVVGSTPLQHDLSALCYGDVNGSYVPGSNMKRSIQMHEEGEMHVLASEEMLIPVTVKHAAKIGAISLVLQETTSALEFLDVIIPGQNGELTYSIRGNEISLAWFGLQALELEQDEALLLIRVRLKDVAAFVRSGISILLRSESEIADENAYPYPSFDLNIPQLKIDFVPEIVSLSELFPNPNNGRLNFRLGLPEAASVQVGIHDIRGALTHTRKLQNLSSGVHAMMLDVSHLATGIYFMELNIQGIDRKERIMRKFVLINDL